MATQRNNPNCSKSMADQRNNQNPNNSKSMNKKRQPFADISNFNLIPTSTLRKLCSFSSPSIPKPPISDSNSSKPNYKEANAETSVASSDFNSVQNPNGMIFFPFFFNINLYAYSCLFHFIFWVLSFRCILPSLTLRSKYIACLQTPSEHCSLLSDLLDSWVYVVFVGFLPNIIRITMYSVKLLSGMMKIDLF